MCPVALLIMLCCFWRRTSIYSSEFRIDNTGIDGFEIKNTHIPQKPFEFEFRN